MVTGLFGGVLFIYAMMRRAKRVRGKMMLELRHVELPLRRSFVLKDINVRIEDGGLVGVIGPNGSGKTTLIRAVTRAIKLAEGEVLLKGKPLRILSFQASWPNR